MITTNPSLQKEKQSRNDLNEMSQEISALTWRLFIQLIRRPSTLFAGILQPLIWPYLLTIIFLIISQILLGAFSIHLRMSEPSLIIGHQLIACLLVAVIAALNFKGRGNDDSSQSLYINQSTLETCHG